MLAALYSRASQFAPPYGARHRTESAFLPVEFLARSDFLGDSRWAFRSSARRLLTIWIPPTRAGSRGRLHDSPKLEISEKVTAIARPRINVTNSPRFANCQSRGMTLHVWLYASKNFLPTLIWRPIQTRIIPEIWDEVSNGRMKWPTYLLDSPFWHLKYFCISECLYKFKEED